MTNKPNLRSRAGDAHPTLASLYSDLADVKIALSDAREALSDKDRRIAELEARIVKAPGASCPGCGAPDYRITKTALHPTFGELGGKNVTRTCSSCGFVDTDLETPK